MGYPILLTVSGAGNAIAARPARGSDITLIRGVAGATAALNATVSLGVGQTTTTVTVGGTITANDKLTISINSPSLLNAAQSITYTVQAADTTSTIATALAAGIMANNLLVADGVTATASAAVITIAYLYPRGLYASVSTSLSGGATETLTVGTPAQSIVSGSVTQIAKLVTNAVNETDTIPFGVPGILSVSNAIEATFTDTDTAHQVWVYLM